MDSSNLVDKKTDRQNNRVTFYGGVDEVTGANFLFESNGKKILVDCGLAQGFNRGHDKNYDKFPYNPAEIDYLFVTHAHTDHIGRIGKLVKDGFRGEIYSTPATLGLVKHMFNDAVHILENEALEKNIKPLYTKEDIDRALSLWKELPYHQKLEIDENIKVIAYDAGHILGSAMFAFEYALVEEGGVAPETKKILFTGDLGNSPTPLLRDTEIVSDLDYIVMESVYGDRNHWEKGDRRTKLKGILSNVIKRKGVAIMPVFSLEKTQVLLHELDNLIESGDLTAVPVFLDSPLAIRLTEVYEGEYKNFNSDIKSEIDGGDNAFDFPKLKKTLRQNQSEAIDRVEAPKIIIAASGISEGGRINRHERRYLPDPNNCLILIGYQIPGSLGKKILDGQKEIRIGKTDVPVRAEIVNVDGYSSHKDSDGLLDFVTQSLEKSKKQKGLNKVFIAMGEPKARMFLSQKIRDNLDLNTVLPEEGQSFEV